MTLEELDATIAEIIIPQVKPKRKQTSYFRKLGDKNKLNKLIPLEKLKNVESDFYKRLAQWRRFRLANENYMFISGIKFLIGVRYSSFTGRLKKFSDCKPRKDVRHKRIIKKIQRRQVRRFKNKIPDGSAYKKISMKHPAFG